MKACKPGREALSDKRQCDATPLTTDLDSVPSETSNDIYNGTKPTDDNGKQEVTNTTNDHSSFTQNHSDNIGALHGSGM